MHTGHYISGGAHGFVVLWAFLGGMFQGEPPEVDVAEVSVISEAQFAALTQPEVAPPTVAEPAALPEPTIDEVVPETPVETVQPERPPEPEAPEVVEPEPLPDVPDPAPEPEIAEEPPLPPEPEPVPEVDAPEVAARPVPRPAPRVAPEVVAEPEPEAEIAPDVQETVEQSETAEPSEAEEQQATAPEAAATEIVTEAEEPARAPERSIRPQVRPNRPPPAQTAAVEAPDPEPAAQPDPEPEAQASAEPAPEADPAPAEPEPDTDATASAIAGALEEALSAASNGTTDGPPLTQGERDGFRIAVQDCWVVDVGSQAANVTVTIGFDMDRTGRIVTSTLRLLASEGGTGTAVDTAFQAARRAILRCQGEGYDLPVEKFDQWKSVEMTFNPENMRIR